MKYFDFKSLPQKKNIFNILLKSLLIAGLLLLMVAEQVNAQRFVGYTDRFDNGTLEFTNPWFENKRIDAVNFYIDRGNSEEKSLNIEIDNFRIAWYLIYVTNLSASISEGKNVRISWKTSKADRTAGFKIYRAEKPGFDITGINPVAEVKTTSWEDKNLQPYKHYFYKVVAVGTNEEVYFPSDEVGIETFEPGQNPEVTIKNVNTSVVKKYEKFEILLDLNKVCIENPFDPKDIDLYALFTSPSGKKIKINGFYDNYLETNQWKIRFSPNETGKYSYQVFVNDVGGTGKTEMESFTVIESEHHGWIKPSDNNPHYFEHDDGTSFYAVGVYSPWRNNMERFETFAKYDANFFAIWDITYGGFVNGTGLIEEELGRYNQLKLGRIDSMLSIFEEIDVKMMYAIWPHDLFSETVWAAQWKQNPYNQLIDVEDVYSDSLVWEYQKKKYRYLIARFAHSRSWGIWELINEMNGTDGWEKGRHDECYEWISKCEQYFNENDPYQHPTTASFSGGFNEYREELYKRNDIPNIHVYPAQGWPVKYPNDTLRSAMYNYAWASRRFWDAFEKPAIFGEAGASLAYYSPNNPNYHLSYHNQIWASLANGLAGIPVWWDYPVLTEQDWQQLQYLSWFVKDIDFANLPYKPAKTQTKGCDVFVMDAGSHAFGWARSFLRENISGAKLEFELSVEGIFEITWYNTWSGKNFKKEKVTVNNGILKVVAPELHEAKPDVAFKIQKL